MLKQNNPGCNCCSCPEVDCFVSETTEQATGLEVVLSGLPTDGDFFFLIGFTWYKLTLPGFASDWNGTHLFPRAACQFTTTSSSVEYTDATITEYAYESIFGQDCPDLDSPSTTSSPFTTEVYFNVVFALDYNTVDIVFRFDGTAVSLPTDQAFTRTIQPFESPRTTDLCTGRPLIISDGTNVSAVCDGGASPQYTGTTVEFYL